MPWTLVTGGGKRLGAAICHQLARQGYAVLIHYRFSAQEAAETRDRCRALGVKAEIVQGDFSTPASTAEFVAGITDVQNLVNNVGHFYINSPLATPLSKWHELFQTNLFAPIQLIQGLMPSIQKHRGSIINIGSAGVNTLKADAKYAAYILSKSALLLLTKSLARELAPSQVRVNMVSPGELDISVSLPGDLTKLPMHRAGTVEEVARAVAFLLDEESGYITGQNLEVAGALGL